MTTSSSIKVNARTFGVSFFMAVGVSVSIALFPSFARRFQFDEPGAELEDGLQRGRALPLPELSLRARL
jgi:hypothetical protein